MKSSVEHQVHVVTGTLKHLNVAMLLAEEHVFFVLLKGARVRRVLGVQLNERLAVRLALDEHRNVCFGRRANGCARRPHT